MNRYSQISTSTYKPLELQEIMMIPMARQAQHDAAQASADEYAALTANRLSQDAPVVDARLNELRGKADEISSSLLEKGVDRNTMASLHKLKREKELEYGQQGLIGNAQANYTAATKFVNELAEKKERQAGWSPAQAKQWAQSQVTGFKGTLDDMGGFRSFSGKELDTKVDYDKWINENMAQVAADVGVTGLTSAGQVVNFTQAFREGSLETKTQRKILDALSLRAQANPDLQASLKQGAAFTGEKDPTNIGKFELVKDNKGHYKEVFKPKSAFGYQLLGAATGAAYRKETQNYHFVDDKMRFKLWERGLEKEDAEALVITTNGGLTTMDPIDYGKLGSILSIAENEFATKDLALKAKSEELIKQGIDPATDRHFQALSNEQAQAKAKYSNAKSNLENIMRKANPGTTQTTLDNFSKTTASKEQLNRIVSNAPKMLERGKGIFRGEDTLKEYYKTQLAKIGVSDKLLISHGIDTRYMDGSQLESMMKGPEIRGIMMQKRGVIDPNIRGKSLTNIVQQMGATENKYRKNAENYIKNNPMSQDFHVFDGSASGEYKGIVGGYQKQLSDTFLANNGKGWNIAHGGGSFDQDILDMGGKDNIEVTVMPTDGLDDSGYGVEQVTIKNKKTGESITKLGTRGTHSNDTQQEIGKALYRSGTGQNKQYGYNMIKNPKLMPMVSSLGIHDDSYTGKVIPGLETSDGKLIYVERNNLKETKISGGAGDLAAPEGYSFRVRLIDKGAWNSNQKVVVPNRGTKLPNGGFETTSLAGVQEIVDALPMK